MARTGWKREQSEKEGIKLNRDRLIAQSGKVGGGGEKSTGSYCARNLMLSQIIAEVDKTWSVPLCRRKHS